MNLLVSESTWASETCSRLISGDKLIVKGVPASGKSSLARKVFDTLGGPTAILIRGRDFTEENQAELRENLLAALQSRVASEGCAQLVFDDYSHALKRSQGRRLQAQLGSLLIDSAAGRDIGALLLSRHAGPIHIAGRGSPLVSRCQMLDMPYWDSRDLAQVDIEIDEHRVRHLVGPLAGYLRTALDVQGSFRLRRLEQVIEASADAILAEMTPAEVAWIGTSNGPHPVLPMSAGALLEVVGGDGPALIAAAANAGLVVSAQQRSLGWPNARNASIQQFATLMSGQDSAIWSDRYLSAQLDDLRRFLIDLRRYTAAHLRLLVSRGSPRMPIDVDAAARLMDDVGGLEVRYMSTTDRGLLHDRHLVFPSGHGYALPTCRVVLGLDAAGSSVATRADSFGVNYEECWQRSSSRFP